MPNVSLIRDDLFDRLGENWGAKPGVKSPEADKAFDELCFEYGIELDDVTTEREVQLKETGAADASASNDILYVIAIPANRYDLLCMEGIVHALRVFMGKSEPADFTLSQPKGPIQRMIVKKETGSVRPIVVCAILRNLTFDKKSEKSFIDLQEKLHVNICRRRTLVSIGTHDLDTIEGPFTYEALPPKEINFVPLAKKDKEPQPSMDGEQLMKHLDEESAHLRPYLPIIRDSPLYPVIYDSKRRVLSLPPIINGNHSKITPNTKNVFIEVTATDRTKANIVLNTICAMFSQYCQDKYTIEPVQIEEADGTKIITPILTQRNVESTIQYITSGIGVDLDANQVTKILKRMSLNTTLSSDGKSIKVDVPITRSDIIHACDVMEDVGIAYGYKNLAMVAPKTFTFSKQNPLNKLTDQLRREICSSGYTEALTLSLCSRDENFTNLRRKDDGSAVVIAQPAEFQIVRTTMLVGLLKMVAVNRAASLPLKFFEISDVVMKNDKADVGSINERHFAAVYCDKISGYEMIQGVLDRVMLLNRVNFKDINNSKVARPYYYVKASSDPLFFNGRGGDVFLNDEKIGVIGVLHPEVLKNCGITFPCSIVEISIEKFV